MSGKLVVNREFVYKYASEEEQVFAADKYCNELDYVEMIRYILESHWDNLSIKDKTFLLSTTRNRVNTKNLRQGEKTYIVSIYLQCKKNY